MKEYWKQIRWSRIFSTVITATCIVLVYMLLNHLGTILQGVGKIFYYLADFVTGLIIAYVLSPLPALFQRTLFQGLKNRKIANVFSVILTYVLLLGLIALLVYFAIPQLADSVSTLAANLLGYYATFEAAILKLTKLELLQHLGFEWNTILDLAENLLGQVTTWLTENPSNVTNVFVNVGSSVVSIVFSLVISIYLLLDWKRFVFNFKRLVRAVVGHKMIEKVKYFTSRSDYIIKGFIRGNLLDALVIGTLNCIFMLIMGMPYNLLISVIVGVTNIIPSFGPIIGYIPCGFILLLINPWQALWFTIFTVVLQLSDSFIIKPIVFKDTVSLSSLWVLVSIMAGGRIGGIFGMLLAIPVTGSIAFLMEDFIRAALARRGIDDPPPPDDLPEHQRQRRDLRKLLRQQKRARRQDKQSSAK